MKRKIGIIGGSGLDDPKLLADPAEIELETPYGRAVGQARLRPAREFGRW